VFCLVRHLASGVSAWLVPAGFFFGMAIACRPHLGLVGALAFLVLIGRNWRKSIFRFGVPFAAVSLGICLYNFERFGNPLEFGTRYLLGNANQTEVHWRLENVRAGLYYLLLAPPHFDKVFPWLHATLAKPGFPIPAIYTLEPIVGALFFAPFLFTILLWLRPGPARRILALLTVSGLGVLLFIAGTGWSVQRYEVDFLQLFVLAALTCAVARLPGVLTALLVLPGLVVGLVMGVNGPYNEMLHNRPARYARIARWFSPIGRYRPQLKPSLDYQFDRSGTLPEGTRDVLFGAGPLSARYELRLEQALGKPRLISEFFQQGESKVTDEFTSAPGRVHIRVSYDPAGEAMIVERDGVTVITHKFAPLVTAPSEVYIGPPIR
jgi:hypothetical protein